MAVCRLLPSSRRAVIWGTQRGNVRWGLRKNGGRGKKERERPTFPSRAFLFETGKALGTKVGRGWVSARSGLTFPIFSSMRYFFFELPPPSPPPTNWMPGRRQLSPICIRFGEAFRFLRPIFPLYTIWSIYTFWNYSDMPCVASAFSLIHIVLQDHRVALNVFEGLVVQIDYFLAFWGD